MKNLNKHSIINEEVKIKCRISQIFPYFHFSQLTSREYFDVVQPWSLNNLLSLPELSVDSCQLRLKQSFRMTHSFHRDLIRDTVYSHRKHAS